MLATGIEPARHPCQRILSPHCLPIPTHQLILPHSDHFSVSAYLERKFLWTVCRTKHCFIADRKWNPHHLIVPSPQKLVTRKTFLRICHHFSSIWCREWGSNPQSPFGTPASQTGLSANSSISANCRRSFLRRTVHFSFPGQLTHKLPQAHFRRDWRRGAMGAEGGFEPPTPSLWGSGATAAALRYI